MGNRFVQAEEPKHQNLTPGDEWFAPKDQPFFQKVWTGDTMGWSTGALSDYPEDIDSTTTTEEEVEEKRAAEAELKEQEKGPPAEESEGDESDEEESDDERSVSSEVSDSDGEDEGAGGKSGSKPKQGGKRKGLFQGRKGR